MALQISGSCHYHPMRPGIGVCVECRQVICLECTTQFEGINRCAACLQRLGKKAQAAAPRREWGALNLVTLLGVFATLFGGVAWVASWMAP